MSDHKDQEIRHKDADLEIEEIIKDYMDEGDKGKTEETPKTKKKVKKPSQGASFSDFISKLGKKIKTMTSRQSKTSKKQVGQQKSKVVKERRDGISPKKAAEYKRISQVTGSTVLPEKTEAQTGVLRSNIFGFMENEKTRTYIIFATKIILAVVILIFLVMLFQPWFTVTGTGAERGIIRLEENMMPDESKEMIFYNEEEVFERVADFSPMSLVSYALNYRETYKLFINEEGTEVTSTVARLHLFYIWLFIIVVGTAVISIFLLIIGKDYQFMHIIRSIGLMSAGIVALNLVSIKIPFFSMLAIRVQSILNVEYPSEVARLTQQGIASGDVSYTYGLELLAPFKTVVILLLIWIVLSAIFGEIMNKMDDFKRMNAE